MRYGELAPHPALRRHVECYWTLRANVSGPDEIATAVLPDGCIDVLFHLGDPVPAGTTSGVRSAVIGAMTEAVPVRYTGTVDLLGIRFRPGGATPFLGGSASELTDAIEPLDAHWGAHAEPIWQRIGETPAAARTSLLDDALMSRLGRSRSSADERVLRASEHIETRHGAVSIDRLADACGLGRRQLERRFLACVGLTPKTAARIARFRALVGRLHQRPDRPLSLLAQDLGYADQAHMTRDFRTLAGTTPSAYRSAVSAAAPSVG